MNPKLLLISYPLFISLHLFAQKENWHSAFAQKQKTEPAFVTENILKAMKKNGLRAGLDMLTGYFNPVIKETLKSKLQVEFSKIDTSFSMDTYNNIIVSLFTDNIILHSLLLKYENRPYRLDLLYYYNRSTWCVQDFSVETNLLDDIKRGGKSEPR